MRRFPDLLTAVEVLCVKNMLYAPKLKFMRQNLTICVKSY
jgi:hypothetical protein